MFQQLETVVSGAQILFVAFGAMVLVPLLIPSTKAMGVDLVHFGVVVVVNMMIGLVTPPFGMLLFVINALTGTSLKGMIRQSLPFMLLLLASLLLMTLLPQTVLWLPQCAAVSTQLSAMIVPPQPEVRTVNERSPTAATPPTMRVLN